MNRTFQTAALLIALAVLFSFAQDSVVKMANKPIAYDTVTVHRVISDSVTIKALENSQSFYESAFKDIQDSYSNFLTRIVIIITSIGVFVAIVGIQANRSIRRNKESNNKTLELQKEQQELLDKFKKEIEESKVVQEKILELENKFRNEFQDNFDTLFRFLSRIYRRSAENFLDKENKEKDIHQYFYYMQIFYRCLIEIKTLNNYDLIRLKNIHDLLSKPKQKEIKAKVEKTDNICWYNVHLLKFINRCAKENKLEYFAFAKSIYNDLFVLKIENFYDKPTEEINFDKLTREIKVCMEYEKRAEAEINEILELAKIYRDKPDRDPHI